MLAERWVDYALLPLAIWVWVALYGVLARRGPSFSMVAPLLPHRGRSFLREIQQVSRQMAEGNRGRGFSIPTTASTVQHSDIDAMLLYDMEIQTSPLLFCFIPWRRCFHINSINCSVRHFFEITSLWATKFQVSRNSKQLLDCADYSNSTLSMPTILPLLSSKMIPYLVKRSSKGCPCVTQNSVCSFASFIKTYTVEDRNMRSYYSMLQSSEKS